MKKNVKRTLFLVYLDETVKKLRGFFVLLRTQWRIGLFLCICFLYLIFSNITIGPVVEVEGVVERFGTTPRSSAVKIFVRIPSGRVIMVPSYYRSLKIGEKVTLQSANRIIFSDLYKVKQ